MTNLIEMLEAIKSMKEEAIDEAGINALDVDIAVGNLEEILESILEAK